MLSSALSPFLLPWAAGVNFALFELQQQGLRVEGVCMPWASCKLSLKCWWRTHLFTVSCKNEAVALIMLRIKNYVNENFGVNSLTRMSYQTLWLCFFSSVEQKIRYISQSLEPIDFHSKVVQWKKSNRFEMTGGKVNNGNLHFGWTTHLINPWIIRMVFSWAFTKDTKDLQKITIWSKTGSNRNCLTSKIQHTVSMLFKSLALKILMLK